MMKFKRRQRTTFSGDQLDELQAVFKCTNYPDRNIINELANETRLEAPKIQVWFQNQRAKCRKLSAPDSHRSSLSDGSFPSGAQTGQVFHSQAANIHQGQNYLSISDLPSSSRDQIGWHTETKLREVFVFNSNTANQAALAVSEGRFESILDYHRSKYYKCELQQPE